MIRTPSNGKYGVSIECIIVSSKPSIPYQESESGGGNPITMNWDKTMEFCVNNRVKCSTVETPRKQKRESRSFRSAADFFWRSLVAAQKSWLSIDFKNSTVLIEKASAVLWSECSAGVLLRQHPSTTIRSEGRFASLLSLRGAV
jgi:hypothetical protein